MRKLKDERKLLWCLKQFQKSAESQKWLAAYLGISIRHFRRLYATYKQSLKVPKPKMGRPKKQTPAQWDNLVAAAWEKYHLNALYLEKVLAIEQKQKIPHNTIHQIMLQKGYACEQASKQKRRKPWIRYEREHSLSAVHMDWHICRAVTGMQVCVVLDDATRKILSGGEFSNATAEKSILLLKEALDTCQDRYNLRIRECICDHGTQFYGVRRDKHGQAEHAFEVFLKQENVKLLLCGVNHPQTNGKVEKWFDFYEHHRGRYASFSELIDWYNDRMHGSLNMHYAETPNKPLFEKCPAKSG